MIIKNQIKKWCKKGTALFLTAGLLFSAAAPADALSTGPDEEHWPGAQLTAPKAQTFTPSYSKKGLQFGESIEDALSLGINYCLFNINITEFMTPSNNLLEYIYNGNTYTFNLNAFNQWGSLFSQLQEADVNLSVEFLLPWTDGLTDLIHPAARTRGAHNYYAWNISTPEARELYAALFSCIAQEFDGRHDRGYISNYLVGNEVNAYDEWFYTGSASLEENANLYADTFQVVHSAVRESSPDARISICLEHSWNTSIPGRVHSGKSFLDTFAQRLKKYDSPDFTIGYHAYSEPLTDAAFWSNSEHRVKDSIDSPCITMKNIEQLTKYVKSTYGSNTRIMLTEQGFSSHGTDGEMKQAAAIAYAYYKAEFNDMIDCIIFRCQADSPQEISSHGLYMGLWTAGMGQMKASHEVFKYMDTPQCDSYTAGCRQYLGINDWSQLVPDYETKYFDFKTTSTTGPGIF